MLRALADDDRCHRQQLRGSDRKPSLYEIFVTSMPGQDIRPGRRRYIEPHLTHMDAHSLDLRFRTSGPLAPPRGSGQEQGS